MLLLQVVTPVVASIGPLGPPPASAPSLEEQVVHLVRRGLRARAVVAQGSPAEQILEQARKLKADLIAMATSGRKGISRILMGSVAEDVVRRMDRAVLLHRIAPRSEALQWSQEQHAPGSD